MIHVPILMYHQVVSGIPEDIHAVTKNWFAEQMKWLGEHGYQGVAVEELFTQRPSDHVPSKRLIGLTFDDGYLDFYTDALPIMRKYGFTGTVFLVAERMGGVNDWDQSPGLAGAPLLDWPRVREMQALGIRLGAHTCTHPMLDRIPLFQAETEIQVSRALIEREIQHPVSTFAYPFSRYTKKVVEMVEKNGYDFACTYTPHYVGSGGNQPYELQRTGILATDHLESFAGKVQARLRWRFRKYWRTFRKKLNELTS